jgi:glutamine synthetase
MENWNTRKQAVSEIAERQPRRVERIDYCKKSLAEVYGRLVFSESVMRDRLPKSVFKGWQKTIRNGAKLDAAMADTIAAAMKDWAMGMGATHYTHWFQPMTGSTAEKHDAFVTPTADGGMIAEFSGKMLIQGEPDASSFPSGGIRSTFEARGYTAWDPTSPVFVVEGVNGCTLCIPTAFYSYTGEALDRKIPLLRSIEALAKQAQRILKLFGSDATVFTTVGPEQEYFLIDKKFYLQRPDLINAGRTLYGSKPPKGQEMEDHYFGAIRSRILAYMTDVEFKLYSLGIPVKTRHNEVAPAQFEIAPVFERANVATDHNMLVMETLRSTAEEHGLVCLLHEKPFAGVNGSGKHNNWSMCDSEGNNLLEPGNTPHENAQFLVYLAAVLRAVHKYSKLLRIGVAGAGNDHRLGANEAPPAIISVFLGEQLEEIVENIISGKSGAGKHGGHIEVGVTALPPLPKDTTDRNRTSPFAFTGNKFEFRAVGSSQSISPANIAINTAVAASLDDVATRLEKAVAGGTDLNKAVQALLQDLFSDHKAVVFNGNNYSAEWPVEAEKRGLPNLKDTVSTLECFTTEEVESVFVKYGVLTKREVHARQEILLDNYIRSVSIESLLAESIGRTIILPAAMAFQKTVADSAISIRTALGDQADVSSQKAILEAMAGNVKGLQESLVALDKARTAAEGCECDALTKAKAYRDTVLPAMKECRTYADELEQIVADGYWPLPKYREMLWIY